MFQKNFTIQRVFKTIIPVHRQDIRPVCCCQFLFLFCFFAFLFFHAVFCRLLHPAQKPQLCFTALKDESNKYPRCHVTPLKNRPGLLQRLWFLTSFPCAVERLMESRKGAMCAVTPRVSLIKPDSLHLLA